MTKSVPVPRAGTTRDRGFAISRNLPFYPLHSSAAGQQAERLSGNKSGLPLAFGEAWRKGPDWQAPTLPLTEGAGKVDWIEVAQRFGFPAAMLFVLIGGLWISMRWIATHVIKPGLQRHFAHMDRLQRYLDETQKVLLTAEELNRSMAYEARIRGDMLKEILKKLEDAEFCRYQPPRKQGS